MRDTKHDLRDEIIRTEKLLEKVESDIDDLEDEATVLWTEQRKILEI